MRWFLWSNVIKTYSIALILYLTLSCAYALDFADLHIAKLDSSYGQLEGIHLTLDQPQQNKKKLNLTINKITLTKPLDDIQFIKVTCANFIWQSGQRHCPQGQAYIRSKHWQSPKVDFSFSHQTNHSQLIVPHMRLGNTTLALKISKNNARWQLALSANSINSQQIKPYLAHLPIELKDANVSFTLFASGQDSTLQHIDLTTDATHLQLQTNNGQVATEKLGLHNQLSADYKQDRWYWHNRCHIKGGLYVDPIYVATDTQPIELQANGYWQAEKKRITLQSINYQHPHHGVITGTAALSYGKKLQIDNADLLINSLDLNNLFSVYLKPFFDPLTIDGITPTGQANSHIVIKQQALNLAELAFSQLNVQDQARRLQVKQGTGTLYWSTDPWFKKISRLSWQQLQLFKIPLGKAQLTLNSWGKSLRLLRPVRLPCLGGFIELTQFSWHSQVNNEPDIALSGHIAQVSLEKLTQRLQWTTLTGKISGHIPSVHYHNKTLHLGGELTINIFDGLIKVTNLASAKLFSAFPIVYSDFELINLDLNQLTGKFTFGNITGRLSGYMKNLTLENWQPTQFFAWFGTPEADQSSHRISQKAVNNIARIGGNAATDLLSRSFLNLFDTFGYDKIGIGCYLYNNRCQMMGVEAMGQGYYLIKGGGLPRIDVIGYNTQIDWPVLLERLQRLSDSDNAVVKE